MKRAEKYHLLQLRAVILNSAALTAPRGDITPVTYVQVPEHEAISWTVLCANRAAPCLSHTARQGT